jgi:hypothetical protein
MLRLTCIGASALSTGVHAGPRPLMLSGGRRIVAVGRISLRAVLIPSADDAVVRKGVDLLG